LVLEPEASQRAWQDRQRARRVPASRYQDLLGQLAQALRNPWVQRAVVLSVIVWVFWDGIWAGVPRADQIQFLHLVSQYDRLWDILSRAPAWNRTQAAGGDEILYRPVLYALLGTFYYGFRYNFVAWQLAGLCLHILAVLGLHLLLIQGQLRKTVYPVLLALLFGTAFFASELVFWNHIVGYVFFCVLDIYAVYFFVRYLQSGGARYLVPCLALSLVGEFTYEAGAVVNLLFAATLVGRRLLEAKDTKQRLGWRGADAWLPLVFVVVALLLPTASLIDLRTRGLAASTSATPWQFLLATLLAAKAALMQIALWLSAWLIPTYYKVLAAERAVWSMDPPKGLNAIRLLDAAGLALLGLSGVLAVLRMRRIGLPPKGPLLAFGLSMIFLFGYALIIAIGRTLSRGFLYVVHANIYYTYMAYLTVCVGIALASIASRARTPPVVEPGRNDGSAEFPAPGSGGTVHRFGIGSRLIPALTLLVVANAYSVRDLAHAYRYDYAVPRQEVIDQVAAWNRALAPGTERYYIVGPTCTGDYVLPWFDDVQFRKNSGWRAPVTFVESLFPDRSAHLNSARVRILPSSIDEIRCPAGANTR
jgi:hypothetical protein